MLTVIGHQHVICQTCKGKTLLEDYREWANLPAPDVDLQTREDQARRAKEIHGTRTQDLNLAKPQGMGWGNDLSSELVIKHLCESGDRRQIKALEVLFDVWNGDIYCWTPKDGQCSRVFGFGSLGSVVVGSFNYVAETDGGATGYRSAHFATRWLAVPIKTCGLRHYCENLKLVTTADGIFIGYCCHCPWDYHNPRYGSQHMACLGDWNTRIGRQKNLLTPIEELKSDFFFGR